MNLERAGGRSQNKKKFVRHTKEFRCHVELKRMRWSEWKQQRIVLGCKSESRLGR